MPYAETGKRVGRSAEDASQAVTNLKGWWTGRDSPQFWPGFPMKIGKHHARRQFDSSHCPFSLFCCRTFCCRFYREVCKYLTVPRHRETSYRNHLRRRVANVEQDTGINRTERSIEQAQGGVWSGQSLRRERTEEGCRTQLQRRRALHRTQGEIAFDSCDLL